MNEDRNELKFLIPAERLPAAPKPLTPGQATMASQRAGRKRLVPLQHAGGKPIRVLRPTTREERRALAKHGKQLRRQWLKGLTETREAISNLTKPQEQSDGQDQTS